MKSSFTLLSLLAAFNSGNAQMGTCPTSCIATASDGTVFDLSGLKGHTMKTTSDSGDGYSFTLCGTDPTQCPNDPGGVFTGMAVQTRSAGSGCYVLAVYDQQDSCQWSPTEPGSNAELTLIMQDGSSQDCMGQDRALAVEFSCPKDKAALIPSTFTATNPTGTCEYVYKVETCAVCPGGCVSGGNFFTTLLIIIFLILLPLYLVIGSIFQYKQGKRGGEICSGLMESTKANCSKVCSCCNDSGRGAEASGVSGDGAGTASPYGAI